MGIVHFHVHIQFDDGKTPREWGAIALTEVDAQREVLIEMQSKGNPMRKAHFDRCERDCFGHRA